MTRIMLLATAMVLMPVYALASANKSIPPQAASESSKTLTIRRPILPCTPLNPCALPPPAISAVPPLAAMEKQARAGAQRQSQ